MAQVPILTIKTLAMILRVSRSIRSLRSVPSSRHLLQVSTIMRLLMLIPRLRLSLQSFIMSQEETISHLIKSAQMLRLMIQVRNSVKESRPLLFPRRAGILSLTTLLLLVNTIMRQLMLILKLRLRLLSSIMNLEEIISPLQDIKIM